MATFRLRPAERWLSCYIVEPLGPLLESYSMMRSLSGRCETKRNNRPVRRTGPHRRVDSVSHRGPRAGVALSDCPVSAPIRLAPFDSFMRSHHWAPGQPLVTGFQIGTLGEPSAAEIEPRATCAHARRKRAHPPARASCARAYTRAHTHTRTRIRARARFVLLSGRNLPATRPFFYI